MADKVEEAKETKKMWEGKEDTGRGDKGGKRGRPTNVEALKKEKSQSMGNMTSIEQIWKRKSETEAEEEGESGSRGRYSPQAERWMFRGSSLVERSPEKRKERMEDGEGLGEIKRMIRELGEDLSKKIDISAKNQGKEIREEIAGGVREKRKTKNEDEVIKENLRELESKWERKEKEEKRRNIIIKGLKAKREEMREKTEEIMETIGLRDAIEEVKVVGVAEGGKEVNMVQVKLKSMEIKRDVMTKKKALRGKRGGCNGR
uniref:high mobility group nucleosome-binding domain-containing protein 5-like n=1 Tax=Osmia lignaria TaxID=473952 RepID=UPI00147810A6|nr:high mobility group nucleosome-binding domain-containing protein 5-like [Osmia lignaria]